MEALNQASLLEVCWHNLQAGQLDTVGESALRGWWAFERQRVAPLSGALMSSPTTEWTDAILNHRAHRHPWYEALASIVTIEECGTFMLENRRFPPGLPLAQRALQAQICAEARAVLQRRVDDAQLQPQAELIAGVLDAVTARVGEAVLLEIYPSLVNRTLVFYYGYYLNVWALVGALFVTEVVCPHRAQRLHLGLRRLGLDARALAEVRHVHAHGLDDRAREWSDGVIGATLRVDSSVRRSIVDGIAVCLETSAQYLDWQIQRLKVWRSGRAIPGRT